MSGVANSLLPCLDKLFVVIAPLLNNSFVKNGEQDSASHELRQQIKQAMNHFERIAQELFISPESIAKAKYGLVAFIDELVFRQGGQTAN
jgi:type VI protein secretion system component VasF